MHASPDGLGHVTDTSVLLKLFSSQPVCVVKEASVVVKQGGKAALGRCGLQPHSSTGTLSGTLPLHAPLIMMTN